MKRLPYTLSLALLIAALFFRSTWEGGAGTNTLELPIEFSLWQSSVTVRYECGYMDNVIRSSIQPRQSAFETISGEAMWIRLPADNRQLNLFVTASDTLFFNRIAGVDGDQNARASAQFSWFPDNDWRTISTIEYVYVNQYVDVSDTYGTNAWQQVRGQGLTLKQGVRADVEPWFVETFFAGTRYVCGAPMDDYWLFGPALSVGRYYGYASELLLTCNLLPLCYDTREQLSLLGTVLPNTSLRLLTHNAEFAWQHHWDKRHQWRTSMYATVERNADNGAGYFDYWRYRLTALARFCPPRWEITMRAATDYLDFDHQRISPADARSRHRTTAVADLRIRKTLSPCWKLFVGYAYERSFSNLAADRYACHTGRSGVEYEF